MKTLAIEISDDVFVALQEDPEQMKHEMRLFAAVKWYEMGRVSQGKAAEIAKMSRADFISALSNCSVSAFQETPEEIARGLKGWGMQAVCNASPIITLAKSGGSEVPWVSRTLLRSKGNW